MRIGHVLAERFLIERVAGRGGMGEVYRALDRGTGQPIAIKVLHEQHGNHAARFEREARILAELDHPRIVHYVAHGALPSGDPYLAMEWLEGEDLAARLARGRLSMMDGITLARFVAEILGAVHDHGLVHRDLKPSNIFLVNGRIEEVKLLDFGLALPEEATRMTSSEVMLGTVAYMAPEQARGERALDARVDIFALGCVLLECLTGEPAFAGSHALAILTKLLFEERPRLCDRLPGAPVELDALLARMLAKSPQERPRDGRAAAEALRTLDVTNLPDTGVGVRLPDVAAGTIVQPRHRTGLTDSEQWAVAMILIGAPAEVQTGVEPDSDARLAAEATAYGGRLERLIDGSAAVLLSGPKVATDLAAQAARCALTLGWHAPGRRLALAIGPGEQAGRQLVGPTIDRAARLLDGPVAPDAPRALVVLDKSTVGLLDARFEVRGEGSVFVLLAERDMTAEAIEARTLLGKPTPCVGRERELRMLEGLFEDCVAGGGAQAVLVTAPPGMGKSRLGQEFVRLVRARAEAAAIWIGRGDLLRAGSALGILGQALRGACGIRDGEPLEVRQGKVRACVAERLPEKERQRVAEFLGELLDTPFPAEDSLPLRAARGDAQLMSEQMRAAFIEFLAAECARAPVVTIVLEDLHWGGRPTVQFINRALRELGDRPLFVLALARPEVHGTFPELWTEHALQEIRLRGLTRKAIEQLARHVLGDHAGADMLENLARLSEGNAFYLEELIRWAAEGRAGELPQTVVAMVQSRLGALDDESRRLLRAASVFGEAFWTGGIDALLGSTEHTAATRDRLAELVERELLTRHGKSRFPDQDEYAFRHALLREGAYAMLTEEDLALGHRIAGAWLEQRGEDDPLMLAEHFEKGGDRARAAHHWFHAAERASWGGDTPRAITYIERGLQCPVPADFRARLQGALCELLFYQLDKAGIALPHAQELLGAAERGSAPWAQALLIKLVCAAQAQAADELIRCLSELMTTEIHPEAIGAASLTLGITCYLLDMAGNRQMADAVFERLTALTSPAAHRVPSAAVFRELVGAGRSVHAQEDPWKGLMHARSAADQARALGHGRYEVAADVLAGLNAWCLGAHAEAMRLASEVRLPDDELAVIATVRPCVLAWMLLDHGQPDEARAWAERLVTAGTTRAQPLEEAHGRWVLAEVLRCAGELDAADIEIRTCLQILGAVCPLDVPGALATLAALRLTKGRTAEALAAAEEGLAKYEVMGTCSQFFRGASLRLVHVECLAAAGQHDAARTALAKAEQRILTNAAKIQEPAYRQSFLEDVPENRKTLALAKQWLGEHV